MTTSLTDPFTLAEMRVMKLLAPIALILVLGCRCVLALGGDYPPGMPLLVPTDWPTGLADLRDHRGRAHGYFVNMEDVFFYAGDTVSFSRFLTNYAALPIASHTLTLHRGTGTARSPWNRGQGVSCDWKMYIGPRWRQAAFNRPAAEAREIIRNNPGYAVSLELWVNGAVNSAELSVPANVTLVPADKETKKDAPAGELQRKQ
jgi:hypothetical protein